MNRVWKAIREEEPTDHVTLELIPGKTEHILQKLLVLHASHRAPDMVCVRLEWVPRLVSMNALEPLDDCVPPPLWQDVIPCLMPSLERNGKRYVIPYDIGLRVILYRGDLFHDHGIALPSLTWTTRDLLDAALRLTEDLDGDGRIDRWGFGIPAARNEKSILQWLPWFWNFGGDHGSGPRESFLTTPAAVEALQWYQDLAYRFRVTPPTFYCMDQETIFQGMASGLFAMTVGGSWELSMLKKLSRFGDKIAMTLMPSAVPGGPAPVTVVDGWGFAVLTKDPLKHESIRRMVYHLSSSEHQIEKYQASGTLPPFTHVYTQPLFSEDPTGRMLAQAAWSARFPDQEILSPGPIEALLTAMQDVLASGEDPRKVLQKQAERIRHVSHTMNEKTGGGTPSAR